MDRMTVTGSAFRGNLFGGSDLDPDQITETFSL